MAWVDQNETDFAKARSLAIRAVKDVLEQEGFTLPEPIYRLRFGTGAGAAAAADSAPSTPDATATEERSSKPTDLTSEMPLDVAPDTDLERMVDDERAASGADEDLLDASRPVE
jgi:hypothetical protein